MNASSNPLFKLCGLYHQGDSFVRIGVYKQGYGNYGRCYYVIILPLIIIVVHGDDDKALQQQLISASLISITNQLMSMVVKSFSTEFLNFNHSQKVFPPTL